MKEVMMNTLLFVIGCMAVLFSFAYKGTENFELWAIATLCFSSVFRWKDR